MNAAIMISIETGGAIGSDIIQCSAADAAALQQALATCQGLIPGEVAQRLAAVFAAMQEAKVTHIDTGVIFPPPPAEMDMTPPAVAPSDTWNMPAMPNDTPPADPLEGVLATPAPQPVEGADPA